MVHKSSNPMFKVSKNKNKYGENNRNRTIYPKTGRSCHCGGSSSVIDLSNRPPNSKNILRQRLSRIIL